MEGSFTVDTPKPSDLHVRESVDLRILESDSGDGIFNADGTVNVVIQRPGAGRGPGNRIFTAEHLKADCDSRTFVGWPCFDNHKSPLARKARAGIPRPPSELAGVVRECWWDPDYTDPELDEKRGYGQGAACAKVMPTEPMEALIRRIPEAIKTSVNALARNLKRGEWKGQPGWVVEGYVNDPEDSSLDFVTRAGAGGDVRRVLQSVADGRSSSSGGYSGGNGAAGDTIEGEDELTLEEALESEAFGRVLEAKIKATIEDGGYVSADEVDRRVSEAVSSQNRIRDLRDHAKRRIAEAKGLNKAQREDLLERFAARDNGNGVLEAAADLDVEPEYEGDGDSRTVKRTRVQVLDAKLDDVFKREREKVSEAAPTIPRGQGPQGGGDGSGDGGSGGEGGGVFTGREDFIIAAHRAGVDTEKVYGVKAAV
jgi:hypothetical protein